MDIRLQVFERLIDSMLTADLAERIVEMRANTELQTRIDELAEKCTEGQLTAEEHDEYETYVEAIGYISILQAKARSLLKHQPLRA